jgi:acyl-CoA synthetase (AMP-forming)/AMP-acid ligase II
VNGCDAGVELRFEGSEELGYDPLGTLPKGEICLRGPIIFQGYYQDEKKTSEAFGESALAEWASALCAHLIMQSAPQAESRVCRGLCLRRCLQGMLWRGGLGSSSSQHLEGSSLDASWQPWHESVLCLALEMAVPMQHGSGWQCVVPVQTTTDSSTRGTWES